MFQRFDIEDRKGLEIVILTALLTFQDSSDIHHGTHDEVALPSPTLSTATSAGRRKTSVGAPLPRRNLHPRQE